MNNRGITLIGLVITIIIMLILAGVIVSVITDFGMFGQAERGNEETRGAQADQLAIEWRTGKQMGLETRTREKMIQYMYDSRLLTPDDVEYLMEWEGNVRQIGLRGIHFIFDENALPAPSWLNIGD